MLAVAGGEDNRGKALGDCWLLNIHLGVWKQVCVCVRVSVCLSVVCAVRVVAGSNISSFTSSVPALQVRSLVTNVGTVAH